MDDQNSGKLFWDGLINLGKMGRLTKEEQVAVEKKLRVCYDMGITYHKAALQTGHSVNTCRRYWNKFYKGQLAERSAPWVDRQLKAVNQFEAVYDEIIFKLNVQLNDTIGLKQAHRKRWQDECAKLRKNGAKPEDLPEFKPDNKLEARYIKIIKLLSEILYNKTLVFMAPFVDEDKEDATLARMRTKAYDVL